MSYNVRHSNPEFPSNFKFLRERYNAPRDSYIVHSPIFPWSLEAYLEGRNHWDYKGHCTLMHCGNDLAHAVLARDEWGIVWC